MNQLIKPSSRIKLIGSLKQRRDVSKTLPESGLNEMILSDQEQEHSWRIISAKARK
jgi:hypothetical protein